MPRSDSPNPPPSPRTFTISTERAAVSANHYRPAIGGEVWECLPVSVSGPIASRSQPRDASSESIVALTRASLNVPLDYPPVADAIVEGDHVALAVDPNVPQLASVLVGVAQSVSAAGAGRLSVVLWEEASDALIDQIRSSLETLELSFSVLDVLRHRSGHRPDLRYVAADDDAEPVYLAKDLVDADFALPIIAARRGDVISNLDRNAIFPIFADAATQARNLVVAPEAPVEAGWLLGVQLIVLVSSDASGGVSRIVTGTPDAVRSELGSLHGDDESETMLTASLVVAALDGDSAAQSWPNVARAAMAASDHVRPGGAIVVWSRLAVPPPPIWQSVLIGFDPDADEPEDLHSMDEDDDEAENGSPIAATPMRSADASWARVLARVSREHRVWLHSELADDMVEEMGIGVVESVQQLTRLAASHETAGVLRAAQFHCQSIAHERRS